MPRGKRSAESEARRMKKRRERAEEYAYIEEQTRRSWYDTPGGRGEQGTLTDDIAEAEGRNL